MDPTASSEGTNFPEAEISLGEGGSQRHDSDTQSGWVTSVNYKPHRQHL